MLAARRAAKGECCVYGKQHVVVPRRKHTSCCYLIGYKFVFVLRTAAQIIRRTGAGATRYSNYYVTHSLICIYCLTRCN